MDLSKDHDGQEDVQNDAQRKRRGGRGLSNAGIRIVIVLMGENYIKVKYLQVDSMGKCEPLSRVLSCRELPRHQLNFQC